ncbi:unnamed protein product [Rotaria sordida]|uniref:AP-3 complex subunit delta domain-containing protein n=1 Tax=Rotaria sordida TaxID=392033 RepID=A0A815ZR99_9BILA|nr:unnamed protein product [Rotaria sordida]CAF1588107.1 unnamed protein product [Rotaria sordida]
MTSTKPYIPAAVNVICELARRNPENYLALAAIFFRLMTTSTNNWVLIKIIKLFGVLTPLELRLGKKLIQLLANLIHILVPISSDLPNHNASIQLYVQKLRILIEDSDRNLKYLGLLAMSTILHTHPKSVQSHSDLIMRCLDLLSRMTILLENAYVFINDSNSTTVSEVLYAAAWICSGFCSSTFLDLDGWINDPQSDSEDESITTSSYYDNKGLFYDDNGENSNSNSHSGDTLSYQKSKKYIESTAEELEKQGESKKQSEQMNPFYLKDSKKNKIDTNKFLVLIQSLNLSLILYTETTSGTINGNNCIELTLSQRTNAISSQLTLSDQLYRQAKIDEENRRLKKKIENRCKITRDGELPENATESGNKGNDNDVRVEKNKKYGPYRALNIDLNEKSIQSIPTLSPLTSQLKESKKKIIEKQEQLSTSKSKHKRERSDDKELLSPADEEGNGPTSTPSPPTTTTAEKTKVKKSSSEITTIVYTNTSVPLLLDIMTDDIHPTNQSE